VYEQKKKGKTVESVKYKRKHASNKCFFYTLMRAHFYFWTNSTKIAAELTTCMYFLSCILYPTIYILHGSWKVKKFLALNEHVPNSCIIFIFFNFVCYYAIYIHMYIVYRYIVLPSFEYKLGIFE